MTKKVGFKAILTVLIISLICSVAGIFAVTANTASEKDFVFEGELSTIYNVNATVKIPEATFAGQKADFRIVYPDGTYGQSSEIQLSKAGLYKVEYSVVYDGRVYKETKLFTVGNELFTLDGLGTSEFKSIGNSDVSGMYFNVLSGTTVEYNGIIDLNKFCSGDEISELFKLHVYPSVSGTKDVDIIYVNLIDAYDENKVVTLKFRHSIHANTYSYVSATFNGGAYCGFTTSLDAKATNGPYYVDGIKGNNMVLTLGTPFDPTICFDKDGNMIDPVYYYNYQTASSSYYRYKFLENYDSYQLNPYYDKKKELSEDNYPFARLNGKLIVSQAKLGEGYHGFVLKKIEGNKAYIEGRNYNAYINSGTYGNAIQTGLSGLGLMANVQYTQETGKIWLGASYDVSTNIAYALASSGQKAIVADFRNGSIFGEVFEGFTDGKVKISITPAQYSSGSCGFFISEIGGKKITKENSSSFVSEYPPVINVDFGEYTEDSIPNVRQGDTYKVFPVKAVDPLDGEIKIEPIVYYGYGNANKVQVAVVDGSFVANRVGPYTIEYKATNSSGLTAIKTVQLNSLKNADSLVLDYDGIEENATVSAGTEVKVINSYEIFNALGNGKLYAKAYLKSNPNVCFELNEKNGYSFNPTKSGVYEICLDYFDYSSSDSIKFEITVEKSDLVYYTQVSPLPDALILNGRYEVRIMKAETLDEGEAISQKVITYVKVDGELREITDELKLKADMVKNGKLTLVYAPDNKNVSEDKYLIKEIPVIDTGLYTNELYKENYFVSEKGNVSFTAKEKGVDCEVNSFDDGVARFSFINTLLPNPTTISLATVATENGIKSFDTLKIYYQDVMNKDNYVLVTFMQKADGWYAKVNEDKELKIADKWGLNTEETIGFSYSSINQVLSINNFYNFKDITFYDTKTPANFENGVKLVMEIYGSAGNCGVNIRNICGAVLNNQRFELVPAVIDSAKDNNAGAKKIGDIITLKPYKIYDVFTPSLKGTVSVSYKPEGSASLYVKSIDNIELKNVDSLREYSFRIAEYGTYTVSVEVKDPDSSRNNNKWSYTISVVNNTKPEITMDTRTRSAKVGEKLSLPTYTIDIAEYTSFVTVRSPDGSFVNFVDINKKTETTDDDTFTFKVKGEYVVTVVVFDKIYNMGEASYKVIVG